VRYNDIALILGTRKKSRSRTGSRQSVRSRETDGAAVDRECTWRKEATSRVTSKERLELKPTYHPGGRQPGARREKKQADARKRFEDLVREQDELALLGLAEVMSSAGAKAVDVLEVLKRAVSVDPNSVNVRLALIGFYLRSKDPNAALVAAQEADSALRNDMRILGALGRAQGADQPNQAIETLQPDGDARSAIGRTTCSAGSRPCQAESYARRWMCCAARRNCAE
jgi:predicted Zn-dependent protease